MARSIAGFLALISAFSLSPLAAFSAQISADPAQLTETVKMLSSDPFEGRAPGTAGEQRTVEYLIARFKAMGLQPAGENGGWTQSVPLVRTQVAAGTTAEISVGGTVTILRQGDQIQLGSLHPVDQMVLDNAPMVFVGYGVTAPERGWDDFKDVDLAGKVAVFLINDPDFEAAPQEPVYGKFGGKAMSYYGRWTYKFEEAARRGAAAALIVHETAGAAYGWSTVIANQGESFDVARGAGDAPPVNIQGWIQRDQAIDLFHRAGLDFEALKIAARKADFRPVPLAGAQFSTKLQMTHSVVSSRNVLAKITGSQFPDETVMFGAHWDAYGVGAPDASGQTIRRGANDDALGVAGVLEVARLLAMVPKPQRTTVFAVWTAEERNLLGSETYARHPIYPLAKTAANFTLDVFQTAGLAHDVVLVGAGQNGLEKDLARMAKAQGRKVTPDAHPEKGLFFRADHFPFAKRGVPTLLLMALGGGADLVEGGREAGNRWVESYTSNCYHKACDAWDPSWDLRGAAQDVTLVFQMGRELASSRRWPQWNDGSEFRAARVKTDAERNQ